MNAIILTRDVYNYFFHFFLLIYERVYFTSNLIIIDFLKKNFILNI